MIKELFKALQSGVSPIAIANPSLASAIATAYGAAKPMPEPEPPKIVTRRINHFHIKRDGRTLCRQDSGNTISWNEAVKRDSLTNLCPGCAKVFYARLNRTLTIIPLEKK